MQTNQQRASAPIMRYWKAGEKRRKSAGKNGCAAYKGIDDFLRSFPIATVNRYGDRVISGIRIC